jgi:ParB-like chromosome segregation protein Spo0J
MIAHEYAAIFPMATDDELKEMASDIEKRGLLNSIITLDGKVLDGRNRLRACEIVNAVPHFKVYEGVDPLGDVISWNLHRRQLTTGQKVFVVNKLATMTKSDACIIGNLAQGHNTTPNSELCKLTVKEASKLMGVSPSSVYEARMIEREAPELAKDIEAGKITVNKAKEQIKAKAQEEEEKKYVDPMAKGVNTKEVDADQDADNEIIMGLRRYWRKATKKEKASFLAWTNKNK